MPSSNIRLFFNAEFLRRKILSLRPPCVILKYLAFGTRHNCRVKSNRQAEESLWGLSSLPFASSADASKYHLRLQNPRIETPQMTISMPSAPIFFSWKQINWLKPSRASRPSLPRQLQRLASVLSIKKSPQLRKRTSRHTWNDESKVSTAVRFYWSIP